MKKQCQSCGMPLHTDNGDMRGTEHDGSKSEKYCVLCYQDGAFVGGDCTVEQMQDIVDTALKRDGYGTLFRWMAKRQIPRLERWKHSH